MNGQIDQRMVLLMLVGCGTVYVVAFEHPSFGTALVVGVAVVTLLHLLTRGRRPACRSTSMARTQGSRQPPLFAAQNS